MVHLVVPSADKREPLQRMAAEWRAHGEDRYALALDDFDGYLARIHRNEDPAQVPADRVPGTEYWLEQDGEMVGCVRLRFALNASLEIEGGHIGYDVRPSARSRGFGTAALRLVLPEAKRRGLDRVLVTCDADNVRSMRIIERCGGVRSATSDAVILRYWIDL
jgi:predicted acetyltransferase